MKSRVVVIIVIVVILLAALHRRRVMRRERIRDAITRATGNRNFANAGDSNSAHPAAPAAPAAAGECAPTPVGYRVLWVKGRPVALWYPTTAQPAQSVYGAGFSGDVAFNGPASRACGKPVPLVVFSHSDTGCGLQSAAFTEELARHGYVVAAPDHADAALCHTAKREGPQPRARQLNVFKPDTWNDSSFIDRRDDIEAVIAELLTSPEFQPIIEPQNIGGAGHSLGGYTVGGKAGGGGRRLRAPT